MRVRPEPTDGHVVIGELGRPHGVVGEVRAYPTGPTLRGLATGATLHARMRAGGSRQLTLQSAREGHDALILRFDQAATREALADLVGAVLEIPTALLPSIEDPDEFYVRDLIGCSVVLAPSGRPLGTVEQVHGGAANDSLAVRGDDDQVVLVPFTHDAIVGFDVSRRQMAVREDLFGGADA